MTQAQTPRIHVSATVQTVEDLRAELPKVRLPLTVPDAPLGRQTRDELIDQLDDYLLPRLRDMQAPLVAVVGGSTGAGKSTIINSLLQREVSLSGAIRPTTRSPVLVHHPDDESWFSTQRVLPALARVTGQDSAQLKALDIQTTMASTLRLVADETVPQGIALLDAPDIDSLVDSNRELAYQLLAAADLWVFLTTAARYADAVPWKLLHRAVNQGVSVAIVLNRVPPDAMLEVRTHFATLLRDQGLANSPMFVIPETVRSEMGFLAPELVAPLCDWLRKLGADPHTRDLVVHRTLGGALAGLPQRISTLAQSAANQHEAAYELRTDVLRVYSQANEHLEQNLANGTLLRGEVLARWQEFIGTGEIFRRLDSGVGRLRDRVSSALRGKPAVGIYEAEKLDQAVQSSIQTMVVATAKKAAQDALAAWRARPYGSDFLGAVGESTVVLPTDFEQIVSRSIRDWSAQVLQMVRTQGASKRTGARLMSLGVNGVGVVLMLVVFSQTAGLSGAELGIAAGTAAVSQRLLEAVFGDQAVRELTAKARRDLLDRVTALMQVQRQRMEQVVDAAGIDPQQSQRLMKLATDINKAQR